jgi:hypothetical protein
MYKGQALYNSFYFITGNSCPGVLKVYMKAIPSLYHVYAGIMLIPSGYTAGTDMNDKKKEIKIRKM